MWDNSRYVEVRCGTIIQGKGFHMKTSEVVKLWLKDLFFMGMIYDNMDKAEKKEEILVRFDKIEEAILSYLIDDDEEEEEENDEEEEDDF